MKTLFKSVLSTSLCALILSCETEKEPISCVQEPSEQPIQIRNGASASRESIESGTFYGTKSVEVAFILTNLN